jgi:hypothetical protein
MSQNLLDRRAENVGLLEPRKMSVLSDAGPPCRISAGVPLPVSTR